MDLKKLLTVLIAALSFIALLCCLLSVHSVGSIGSAGSINPPTGDYLNIGICASLGVLALLVALLTATARSKRR